MGNVKDWFKKHKIQIGMQINEKPPICTPSHVWYIYLLVVSKFSCLAATAFKCLQGHHVTVLMQRMHLMTTQTSLLHAVGRHSPLSDSEATDLDESQWVYLGVPLLLRVHIRGKATRHEPGVICDGQGCYH